MSNYDAGAEFLLPPRLSSDCIVHQLRLACEPMLLHCVTAGLASFQGILTTVGIAQAPLYIRVLPWLQK